MPPILRLDVPGRRAEMDVKPAYVEGLPVFVVKVSTGFFNNAARGLPSLGELMIAFDTGTGHVRAVLLDNGCMTDVRTSLAGAVGPASDPRGRTHGGGHRDGGRRLACKPRL